MQCPARTGKVRRDDNPTAWRPRGAAGRVGGAAIVPGLEPGSFLEVVNMTGNQKSIQWGRTHQNGPRKGTKSARNGRKPVSARQSRLDGLATALKGFIGSEGFVSVREVGPVIQFRENGAVIAQADGTQDFGNAAEAVIDVVFEDNSEAPATLERMADEKTAVSSLAKGMRRKCWLVKTTDGNGRATYRPEGVAYVDGKAMPVREGAARSFVAMQIAWAMGPKSARKDGKRVKFNVRSRDGKGTRYTFRYDGADIAEFYHDGRFEDLRGDGAKPLEHYLARAGIPCVENGGLMAKFASCMVSPRYDESDIAEKVEDYDNDEAYFADVSAQAVKAGLIRDGQSIADFNVVVKKNRKTGEQQFMLFPMVDRRTLVDTDLDFGGAEPSEAEASPAERQPAGRGPSQTKAAAATAPQCAAATPAAA